MTYWDTSALCPLLRDEPSSDALKLVFEQAANPTTSWIALIEVLAT